MMDEQNFENLSLLPPDRPRDEAADESVESALYWAAVGRVVRVPKAYKLKQTEFDEKGKKIREWEEVCEETEPQYIAGSFNAQKLWLERRQRARWGDEAGEEREACGVVLLPEANAGEGP